MNITKAIQKEKKMPLDIKAKLSEIDEAYKSSSASTTMNALLVGPIRSGKTVALATAPKPNAIDTFDTGGVKSIRPQIDEGGIHPTPYEEDDPKNPFAFRDWLKEFNYRYKEGFFDYIASYCIDSFTYFFNAALFYEKALAEAAGMKRHRSLPALDDYRLVNLQVVSIIQKIMSLPCNFFLTAHVAKEKDVVTGKYVSSIVASPKIQETLPAMFDEVYIMQVDPKQPVDKRYRFLTDNDGIYECGSRLATVEGRLDKHEPANLRHILKKVGLPYEDREIV